MERLYLGSNRLEGTIPSEIGQLQRLGLLSLSRNKLSGRIPDSLGSLEALRRLFLSHNELSGEIPLSLRGCKNLELLDLSSNELRGSIPGEVLTSLKNLQFYLNLSWNALEGSLPPEVGNIAMVQSIDILGNKLDGGIPEALGSCTGLISLNLSNNALQDTIPEAFSNLRYLVDLDLSSNVLSGQIPELLKKLEFLRYLNLSFNIVTGEVPKGGVFANATAIVSLIGNSGLCGPRIFLLPECLNHKSHSHNKTVIIAVSSASAFAVCCLVLGFLWRYISPPDDLPRDIMKKFEHLKISYEDLFSATDGFNESKLVGVGSFGSVYRGDLKDGKAVVVKVLNLNDEEAHKSFDVECKVLRKV
ncbi:hypothetical protein SUGI_1085910 [Cryptomeria japonica]|nr:hypothetical protein SUGI_1085910 [Cryptomeria japonica]